MALSKEDALKVLAEKVFGKPIEFLTDAEKGQLESEYLKDIYADFEGKEAAADQQYELGEGLVGGGNRELMGSGRQMFADWGGALGDVAKSGAGAYVMDKAGDKRDALSKQKAQARQLAGQEAAAASGKAADQQQDNFTAMLGAMNPQQGAPQGAPQAPPQQPPQAPMQAPQATPPPPAPSIPVGGALGGGPPLRPGQQGAPMPSGGQMPTGGKIPQNREEWLARMLRMGGG